MVGIHFRSCYDWSQHTVTLALHRMYVVLTFIPMAKNTVWCEKRTQLSESSGKWLPQQGWQATVESRQRVSHVQLTQWVVFSECTRTARDFPHMGMSIVCSTHFRTDVHFPPRIAAELLSDYFEGCWKCLIVRVKSLRLWNSGLMSLFCCLFTL